MKTDQRRLLLLLPLLMTMMVIVTDWMPIGRRRWSLVPTTGAAQHGGRKSTLRQRPRRRGCSDVVSTCTARGAHLLQCSNET